MTALILTGPRDGELIDCNRPFLEMEAPPTPEEAILAFAHLTACTEPLSRKKLTFRRVTFYDGHQYVLLYVPLEWPSFGMKLENKVLGHLLRGKFREGKADEDIGYEAL